MSRALLGLITVAFLACGGSGSSAGAAAGATSSAVATGASGSGAGSTLGSGSGSGAGSSSSSGGGGCGSSALTLDGLVVSPTLRLSASTVALGQTLSGSFTLCNPTSAAITLSGVDIAARPPGGSDANGPFGDLYDGAGFTLAPGASQQVSGGRTFTSADTLGVWYAYVTLVEANGTTYDGNSMLPDNKVTFTVVAAGQTTATAAATGTSSSSGATATASSSSGASSGAASGSTSSSGSATGYLHAVMGTNGKFGHLENAKGEVVVLHGADESGTENYCTTAKPPTVLAAASPLDSASLTAMQSWGMNAVRIPLNEDCWLGINGVEADVGDTNYITPIQTAVNLYTSAGMYVILDLHWSLPGTTIPSRQGTMPDLDHTVDFWRGVAGTFAGNGSVIFDVFNEPVMGSGSNAQQFTCLLNGSTAANSGDCPMVDFAVAGWQTLLNAIRGAGAGNLVMLGGPGYSSQLGLWPQYLPTDTLNPPNIAASWHVYDDQGGCTSSPSGTLNTLCPTSGLGAASVMTAGYPVIIGETGYYSCSESVGQAWWPLFLSWADTQGLSYLAWSWSDGNDPQLLSSVDPFTAGGIGPTYQTFLTCIDKATVTPATACTTQPETGCE